MPDQLFNNRQQANKKNVARRKSNLTERERVLIVCEGKKTEPIYFRDLITHLGLKKAAVKICTNGQSAPISVVNFGIEKFNETNNFEHVFFVFDRDDHESYQSALQRVDGFRSRKTTKCKTVQAITSVPCFEIWFLLHFYNSTKSYVSNPTKSACNQLISTLKKEADFANYEKGKEKEGYFNVLKDHHETARKNAAILLKQNLANGEGRHTGNPSTLVHELISCLETVAAAYQR
ncbi:MAG: RloB domain-containing protein [Nitrospirae bacterium]|nr:RloB domain-containing protein [Magnetococcales bacterium]